jgi:hypothetical protein
MATISGSRVPLFGSERDGAVSIAIIGSGTAGAQ